MDSVSRQIESKIKYAKERTENTKLRTSFPSPRVVSEQGGSQGVVMVVEDGGDGPVKPCGSEVFLVQSAFSKPFIAPVEEVKRLTYPG